MKSDKKGVAAAMLAKLIIVIIGFFLVAYVIANIADRVGEEATPQACLGALKAQDWLIHQAGDIQQQYTGVRSSVGIAESQKPWPRVCQTQDVTVDGRTSPEVSQKIIRLLGDCWYQMGSGRFSPFDADWLGIGVEKCFVCYTFRAPDLQEPITDVQFNSYLKEISFPGSDESLYDTFNQDITELYEPEVAELFGIENIELLSDEITSGSFYAVGFFDLAADTLARIVGRPELGGVAATRAAGGGSKLYIVPIDQARECVSSGEEAETGD